MASNHGSFDDEMNFAEASRLVRQALERVLAGPITSIRDDAFLSEDLALESVDILNLLVEIERLAKRPVDLGALGGASGAAQKATDFTLADLARALGVSRVKHAP